LAFTRTLIEILPALRTQPGAIFAAEGHNGYREQDLLANRLGKVNQVVIVDREGIFRVYRFDRNTSYHIDGWIKPLFKVYMLRLLEMLEAACAL
jgi:hypothetical protein